MPYLLLVISAICLAAMSLLRKEYDKRSAKGLDASFRFIAITFSIIALICAAFLAASGSIGILGETDGLVILLGVAYCLVTFITTVICIVSASYGSVAIIVASANIGILTMSTLYGLIFDSARNKANVFTWLGLALVVAVIVFTVLENSGGEADRKKRNLFKLFCIGAFLSNGPALVLFSLLTKHRPHFGGIPFLLVYSIPCILLALVGLLVTVWMRKGNAENVPCGSAPKSRLAILLVVLYAISALISEFLALINTADLPIIVQSPLSFAIPAILLTVSERIFYKTPITKSNAIKLSLSFVSCVMFALAAM